MKVSTALLKKAASLTEVVAWKSSRSQLSVFPWERAAEEDREEAGACDGACPSVHPSCMPAGLGILKPTDLRSHRATFSAPSVKTSQL